MGSLVAQPGSGERWMTRCSSGFVWCPCRLAGGRHKRLDTCGNTPLARGGVWALKGTVVHTNAVVRASRSYRLPWDAELMLYQ